MEVVVEAKTMSQEYEVHADVEAPERASAPEPPQQQISPTGQAQAGTSRASRKVEPLPTPPPTLPLGGVVPPPFSPSGCWECEMKQDEHGATCPFRMMVDKMAKLEALGLVPAAPGQSEDDRLLDPALTR